MGKPYIAVDLDGTLAEWHGYIEGYIGPPIPLMVNRVREWISQGKDVRIFTARVAKEPEEKIPYIQKWCLTNIGTVLPVTCCKDEDMEELWDDRAIQIVRNTALRADGVIDNPADFGDLG